MTRKIEKPLFNREDFLKLTTTQEKNDYLRGVNLNRADLSDMDLSYMDLSGLDFRHGDLRNSIFHRANFRGAKFSYANFYGADLTHITCVYIKRGLTHEDLDGARTKKTNVIVVKNHDLK